MFMKDLFFSLSVLFLVASGSTASMAFAESNPESNINANVVDGETVFDSEEFASDDANLLAAEVNWTVSKDFGSVKASMKANGNLVLYMGVSDTKGDSTAVAAQVEIISGDKKTVWIAPCDLGVGNYCGRSKTYDGSEVGFSGYVTVRICKYRANGIPGSLTYSCSTGSSRTYSL